MKTISALGVILGGAMIIGCASGTPAANTPASTPAGAFEVAQEQLARSVVGITTLTSAPVANARRSPLITTDEVYAPAAAAPASARTWGAASEPGTLDDDLAQNPYNETRDIYDPR